MGPQAFSLASGTLLAVTAVVVAWLGARMLARDAKRSRELPGLAAEFAALTKRVDSMHQTIQGEREADRESVDSRLAAANALAQDALETATTVRRRLTKAKAKVGADKPLLDGFAAPDTSPANGEFRTDIASVEEVR